MYVYIYIKNAHATNKGNTRISTREGVVFIDNIFKQFRIVGHS